MKHAGQKIRGKRLYTVTGIHATGGQSQILTAHGENGEDVAIKIPHASARNDTRQTSHLIKEAFLLRRLTRARVPGVVQYIEHGVWEDAPFLACELLHGETLEVTVHRKRPSLQTCLDWFISLIETLMSVHRQRIIHGDLSARNVMLCNDKPVLIDLGIARDAHDPIVPAGSIGYLAPEVLNLMGNQDSVLRYVVVGGHCQDVYALGILLHEMITGKIPFQIVEGAMNPWYALAYQHLTLRPPNMLFSEESQAVGTLINALVQEMLAKDPAHRPALHLILSQAREIQYQLTPRDSFESPPTWFHSTP